MLLPAQIAAAAGTCFDSFQGQKQIVISTPKDVLTSEYDRSQILAIGVNDHVKFQPFDHLATLIRERGLDPALKTVIIEDSVDRSALYAELSVHEMEFSEFEKRATDVYGMFSAHEEAIFKRVMPVVREINKLRPNDPLLVLSIDGVNNHAALEIFASPIPVPKTHSKKIDSSKLSGQYIGSIQRERATAQNFKTLVTDRYPGRKTIVAYQATHIAKNLSAIGADTIQGSYMAKRSFLGWLSIATSRMKLSESKVRVVLVDSIGEWSPAGVLNLPNGLQRPKNEAQAIEWNGVAAGIDAFKLGTFLRDYREGSVTVIDRAKPVFDAVIVEPQIDLRD